MRNGVQAIPTKYAGVQFRSRLEARYAVLLDLLGWRWAYEPLDLAGWIPDFVIHGARPILVEVKPIFAFDGTLGARIRKAADLLDEVDAPPAKDGYEALICGADLTDLTGTSLSWLGDYGLGWLWDYWWDPAAVFYLAGSECIGLCHCAASYRDRISGATKATDTLARLSTWRRCGARPATRCSGGRQAVGDGSGSASLRYRSAAGARGRACPRAQGRVEDAEAPLWPALRHHQGGAQAVAMIC